jgi:MFS family permease
MKILIAYYSRNDETERVAGVLKKELEKQGHFIDTEKIKPQKERGFWGWQFARIWQRNCPIQEPKIKNVSLYDAVCLGSPNWTRLSLPVAGYLKEIEGLKDKNVLFFSTSLLPPLFEWFTLSGYLLDLTLSRALEEKKARLIDSVMVSSFFKEWKIESDYGKRAIKNLCQKISRPIDSLKQYFLTQKESGGNRLLVVAFSFLLFFSIFLQTVSYLTDNLVFSWPQYFSLITVFALSFFAILTLIIRKKEIFLAKYLAGLSLVIGWTLTLLFWNPFLDRAIISGYVLIFIFISFFQDVKAVFFTGLAGILSYLYLLLSYPFKTVFSPLIDLLILIFSVEIISFVAEKLKKDYLALLEAREEIETTKNVLEVKVRARTRELRELAQNLDQQVKEKTKELEKKIEEMERFNRLVVGRELRMVELKKEVEKLKEELEKRK